MINQHRVSALNRTAHQADCEADNCKVYGFDHLLLDVAVHTKKLIAAREAFFHFPQDRCGPFFLAGPPE